ncbi:MAG: hypothetical protein FWD74_09275 [Actinomycetia bacterium]|nr:hypothetical protein [Actinomycetes bacterium]
MTRPDDPAAPDPDRATRPLADLSAASYLALVDVDPALGAELIVALHRARIPAYLDLSATGAASSARLFVATEDRADARTVVAAVTRGAGPGAICEPVDEVDTEARFTELIADWHVDTINAIRTAERDLTTQDADWRARLRPPENADEDVVEHYQPPAPPPLPRLSAQTVGALVIIGLAIAVLAVGGRLLALPTSTTLFIGVTGILAGAGMLVMRLRDQPPDPEEEEDDGAVL